VKRYKRLPSTPTKEDLQKIAAKLLAVKWNAREQTWNVAGPAPNRDFIQMMVGYALTCKMRLPAIAGTVEEARFQARENGRSEVIATDIRTALFDHQIPSDEALQQTFDPPTELPKRLIPSPSKLALVSDSQWRCRSLAS
jgi:hypothetical protein